MEYLESRLTILETEIKEQTRILRCLETLPPTCAARGVQLEQLLAADLPARIQAVERDLKGYRTVVSTVLIASATALTHKYWGAIFLALHKAFI